ncbi:MAG: ribose-phosphate pyrophosphokinase [Candidatus Cloacimonas sp. 4484_209]|nr:MAG: ribose-phosphate pyrophosphokinase [Candidatus Cloacimonas sp. 4484_209]
MAKNINKNIKVFSGNSNPALVKKICSYLGIKEGKIDVLRFSDGEIRVKIGENIRGKDVFIVQSTHPPAENLLELLIMMDAAKRASARRITAVTPYFGYARQDKKDEPRVPISAKLVADLITSAGANRVLAIDLHVEQIQGFFNIPFDHLYAAPVIIEYFKHFKLKDFVVVSPDPGGVNRSRGIAKRLGNLPIAIIDKRRPEPNKSSVINIVGKVKDKNVLIVDDIIDTGGTIVGASAALKKRGAKDIYVCCTHPVLSGNALERINKSALKTLVVTDTIPLGDKKSKKITILSVSKLIGEAIKRIHEEKSVSSLFV